MTASRVQEPLSWLFGDLFERRLEYELAHHEVLWSRLARALVTGGKTAECWQQWVAEYRAALTNTDKAPFKVAEDLQIDSCDFTAKLMDVFAEIAAAVHLSRQGAVRFQPISRSVLKTPDFICEWGGVETAVEVKNLHAHDFIEDVMLDLYLDAGLKSGNKPERALVMQRSDRGWLSKSEIEELRALVRSLPEHAVGQVHTGTLQSGKAFVFRLEEGGDSRSEDGISLDDLERDLAFRQGLLRKVARVATDALDQLLSASVQHVQRRVIAMRWDIPWYGLLQPADLPDAVRGAIASALSVTPQPIEAIFFHDFGQPLTVYRS